MKKINLKRSLLALLALLLVTSLAAGVTACTDKPKPPITSDTESGSVTESGPATDDTTESEDEDVDGDTTESDGVDGDTTESDDVNGDTTESDDVNGDTTESDDVDGDTTESDDVDGDTTESDDVDGDTTESDDVGGDETETDSTETDGVIDPGNPDCQHQYDEGVVQKSPNCTDKGYKIFTCVNCGQTKRENIDALGHKLDGGVVVKEPTCGEPGIKKHTCSVCKKTVNEEIPATGVHVFGEGVVTKDPTVNEEGVLEYTCTQCGEVKTEAIEKLPAVYTIVMQGFGEHYMAKDGVYSLPDPERCGYKFIKWVKEDGSDFAAEGVLKANATVIPVFELLPTNTVEELEERAAAGVDRILIAKDIVIDRTIYVTGTTTIYTNTAAKIIRDENFAGDMFVVGQNKEGLSSVLNLEFLNPAKLILGTPGGSDDNFTLIIDGNRDNMKVDVVGSAFFLVNGGNITMYSGVAVKNHIKVDNERAKTTVPGFYVSSPTNAGGAAFFVGKGSTFTMYGGLIDNNSSNLTSTLNEEGTAVNLSAYGGAIYNNGNFYMHGGVISNNSANRGGGIYTNWVVKIYSGVLVGNYAKNKGGAICSSGSDAADIFISTEGAAENNVIFRDNSAGTQGGAILSYFDSPIVIYQGTVFDGNKALGGNGGAISTSGPVTAYNVTFINNSATSYGGSVYQTYSGGERIVRFLTLESCRFESNRANRGGAVCVTSSDEAIGTIAFINNCEFVSNTAYLKITEKVDSETGEIKISKSTGNGGAIYSSQHSTLNITDCLFSGNKAENLGGGAIGATVASTVKVDGCTFVGNAAVDADGFENGISGVGGALYVYNKSQVTVKNSKFMRNSAAKNGGAIYCSDNTVTLENVEFDGNIAGEHGGAISQHSGSNLTIKGIKAYSNSAAGYGGVIYNSKSTVTILSGEGIENLIGKMGETDEETAAFSNTASSGGAICAGNASIVTIDGTTFTNNSAIGGGGFDYNRYGGAIYGTYSSQIKINNTDFVSNSAGYGGAVSLMKNETLFELTGSKLTGNTTTNCGGAIYVLAATANLTDIEAKQNVSAKGGVLYLSSQSDTTVGGKTVFAENTATYGGAVYASSADTASFTGVEFSNNGIGEVKPASQGGAIYVISAELVADNCSFSNNVSTSRGGALYLAATETKTDDQGVESTTDPAIVNLLNATFNNNSSKNGGAVYASTNSRINVELSSFVGNSAKRTENDSDARGGAFYMLGATLTANDVSFEENSADFYGGAIDGHTGSTVNLTGVTFTSNTAKGNGGAMWMYTNTVANITDITATGNRSESYGGFVYTRGEFNLLTSDGETNVFEGNSSKSRGGALAAAASSVLNVVNTQFKNNEGSSGGAIYSLSETTLTDCVFDGNSAASGGAICVSGGTTTTLDCVVSNNTAKNYGGAVYVTENSHYVDGVAASELPEGETNTRSSSFTGNTASSGGAIYSAGVEDFESNPDHTAGMITLNGSEFTSNSATNGGAVGVGKGCVLTDNASTYTNNTAWHGGAIIVVYDGDHPSPEVKAYINGSSFIQNTAAVTADNNEARGGAIYVGEYATIHVTGAVFEENTAAQYGGAISGARGSDIVIADSEFTTNSSGVNGGAVWAYSESVLTFSESAFTGNSTAKAGGALYAYGQLTASDCGFEGNGANSGGAVCMTSAGNVATLRCEFVANTATSGGAVWVSGGATYTDGTPENSETNNGSTFTSNTAYRGGAIYVELQDDAEKSPATVTLEGSVLTSNASSSTETASDARGGAIYLGEYDTLFVNNATFTGNTASVYGGAISAARGTNVTVKNSSFSENTANTRGGAIWKYEDGSFTVEKTEFTNNQSKEGGAIRTHVGTTIADCVFTNNKGTTNGGALYAALDVTVTNSTFTSNNAKNGGGVFLAGGTSTIRNCAFVENNTANGTGGAIYLDGAAVTAYDTTFESNAVYLPNVTSNPETSSVAHVRAGGAVAVMDGASLTAENCEFDANKAYIPKTTTIAGNTRVYGGTIVVSNATLNIIGGSIKNGSFEKPEGVQEYSPRTYGAAIGIYGSSSAVTVSGTQDANVLFEGNKGGYGGAIGAVSGGQEILSFEYVTFKDNSSTSQGGALYFNTVKAAFNNVTATGNTTSGNGGVFYANSCKGITIENSSFSENGGDYGGAIYIGSSMPSGTEVALTVRSTIFTANSVSKSGGAIYTAAVACVENSTFDSNNAQNGYGGAIYVTENASLTYTATSTLGVTDGVVATDYEGPVFKNNVAISGGAIYLESAATEGAVAGAATITGATFTGHTNAIYTAGVLNTNNCVFYKNTGAKIGAAISTGGSSTYTDNGSVFVENSTSGNQAGAVYLNGDATFTDSKFYRNSATAGRGGAILATGSKKTLTVNGGWFEGNTASTNGGAVVLSSHKLATFEGCTFKGNEAGSRAGAIYGTTDTNTVTIACVFTDNSATSGGAISTATSATYRDGVEGQTDKGSTFIGNSSTGLGGALHLTKTTSLYGSKFENNKAGTNGGAIYISSDITIVGATFDSNEAGENGGAIYVTSAGSLDDDSSVYTSNVAVAGGAIYTASATTAVKDSTFDSNKAIVSVTESEGETVTTYGNGGAVFVAEKAAFTYAATSTLGVTDGVVDVDYNGPAFKNNVASIGGAIYLEGNASVATLTGASLIGNAAMESGGAVYIYAGASVSDIGSVYSGNTAVKYGGAIAAGYLKNWTPTSNSITLDKSVFADNIAEGYADGARGGAVFMDQSHIAQVTESKFYRNTSTIYGGAISAARDTELTVIDSYFEANDTVSRGGAIWKYEGGELIVKGSQFKANDAKEGGAIRTHVDMTLTDCEFTENRATSGGAIYATLAATVNGCEFNANSATNGGAIYVASGTTTVTDCTFSQNTAIDNGGAVYAKAASEFSNCEFISNKAANGGAIYTSGNLTATNCDFLQNTASTESGGAIYVIGAVELNVIGGTMKGNKTVKSKSGGAIAAFENDSKESPTVKISGTVFEENSSYSGGAICLRNTGTTKTEHVLENITLINNTGGNGAIYIYNNTKVTVSGLVATDNTAEQRGSVFYLTSSNSPTLVLEDAQVSGNRVVKAGVETGIDVIHIANASAVLEICMDQISGADIDAAGITDTTDIAAAGWDKLINNASSSTHISGYNTPEQDTGSGEGT